MKGLVLAVTTVLMCSSAHAAERIYPQSAVETCKADVKCLDAERTKFDQSVVDSLKKGTKLTPAQEVYAKLIVEKQYSEDLTFLQDEIAMKATSMFHGGSTGW
jgi:hypothetical protein